MKIILEVKNLSVDFETDEGVLRAVDHVSFELERGKNLGIVGESGCGKSVTGLALMQLIPKPPGKISSGEIIYQNQDLLKLDESTIREMRGNQISMIFQEPMTSLNPVFTIGNQISEVLRLHEKMNSKEARARAIELLQLVEIPSPENRIDDYSHQLSGGMRQRVMIAMAIACDPKILIADEPTTALDVTIQAQILDLLKELQEKINISVIMITHDLGVVAEFCDDVIVMYTGQIVEKASAKDLFNHPSHPYTQGLLRSLPSYTQSQSHQELVTIPGMVPALSDLPLGCRFQERCQYVEGHCRRAIPELEAIGNRSHWMRCIRKGE